MLKLRPQQYDQIRREAEAAYPDEGCGVLVGVSGQESRSAGAAIPCANASRESSHHRYSIDPLDLVRVQREARERGLEIVGFYHSHPDHPAQWSATDLAEAHWIGCSYVITSVESGRAAETKSYVLAGTVEEDKRFVAEEVMIA